VERPVPELELELGISGKAVGLSKYVIVIVSYKVILMGRRLRTYLLHRFPNAQKMN
jgi:hypothetical protein